ncbi:tRNA (cytosine-5-)-methyltransferase ncl1 [Massospora cicadina]|nr:tRNA (cytosine-5-)-methyltransferase ncl1 [Massospora cicadina]
MGKPRRVKGKFQRNGETRAQKIIPEGRWGVEILDAIEKRYVPSLTELAIDGEVIEPPTPLPWYPNRFGWHVASSRAVVRKSVEYSNFHRFLVSESEVGNLSRQEAVSMVPPLMLDVQPHHWVLDMCAAPGSKTAQLIEALHGDEVDAGSKFHVPSGLVLANDSDEKRCYTLVHQIKRLRSPNFIVTNHEAQNFSQHPVGSRFDRILCDVPCSGDGTLRKNLLIWKDWHVGQGLSLHVLQASILARGIQLLKVGGRLVYSTCSLNPLENEAVVASALNAFSGKIRLVDSSQMLPELQRCPGLTSWKVFIKKDVEIKSYDELEPADKKKKWAAPTLFPPEKWCISIRIYPHLQNTGGFFVTVFEKIGATSSNEQKHPVNFGGSELALASEGSTVEAPVAVSLDCAKIEAHYKLEGFPTDQFLVRSESEVNKTVSFASRSICQLLSSKDICRLKVINTGVKAFQRISDSRRLNANFASRAKV